MSRERELHNPDVLGLAAAQRLARRPWPAQPIRQNVRVSFEFFPPTGDEGARRLGESVAQLGEFDPEFVSVTYGAGGSTQSRTLATLASLTQNTTLDVAGHLTCVSKSKREVNDVVDAYASGNITRIVALRGDAPVGKDGTGPIGDGYQTAADLVAGIRSRPDGGRFDISVAGYPEVHPMARNWRSDIDALKRKVDAGADRVITQFFFDHDEFVRFFERARAAGIDVPIVPGIMPVTNFAGLSRFAERCGTMIPEWMPGLLGDLDDDPDVQGQVAATIAAEQCRRLHEYGIDQFHFYTMNRSALTAATCRIMGLRPQPRSADIETAERSA